MNERNRRGSVSGGRAPPQVSFVQVREPSEESVLRAVRNAMELAGWRGAVQGGRVFVKINAVSAWKVPGANTSPWVLKAVLEVLREKKLDILVGDGDTATSRSLRRADAAFGYSRIAAECGARFVNLSEDGYREVEIPCVHQKKVSVPETLLDVDQIISVPVMKTHTWAGFTCALKNQYGCTPQVRHRFHLFLDDFIAAINAFLQPAFAVVDGTVCMEDGGPVVGRPKVCDVILSSRDLAAADRAVARFMGLNEAGHPYILLAVQKGYGSPQPPDMVGDPFETDPFLPARGNFMSRWHRRLRYSFLEPILFRTPLFGLSAVFATLYKNLWYRREGKAHLKRIVEETPYGKEFA